MGKIKLIVVAGPTASGKSDLAIRLARRFDGEIISADSRQVYRGMNIGTGKVTRTEQKLARHWLLDITSPKCQYSVARWKTAAQRAIRDIVRRGKLPIICGGTGHYIDALVYDQALPAVRPDAKLRARFSKLTASRLFAMLQKLDPARAATIDPCNPRRLIRALEIVLKTSAPVPPRTNRSPYRLLYLGIARPMPRLRQRIKRRLDARLRTGMLAEVRRLRRQGISWKRLESFGLEYRWLARHLQGDIGRDEMRERLLADIVGYAKRQMTWWHRNQDIRWVKNAAQTSGLLARFL